jgi:hypothetical protein
LSFTLFDQYGPTENTVVATWTQVSKGAGEQYVPSIGRPVAHTEIYLLDEQFNPVPQGVAGQLYLGGGGLARGYLRRPALTAERFVPHPFSAAPGARLYRTGDLARFLPGGRIQFLGRADEQVKLWGYRIEKGEIEAALREQAGVAEAVVEVRQWGGGGKRLVGYVVPVGGMEDDGLESELREHLRRKLPGYMVPSAIVPLERLPLTPNGKVDRRALPSPEPPKAAKVAEKEAPATELERVIAEVWQSVLGVESVGAEENFFDLGGHSLALVAAYERLRPVAGERLTVMEMFEHASVRRLARHLSGGEAEAGAGARERARKQKAARQQQQQRTAKGNAR